MFEGDRPASSIFLREYFELKKHLYNQIYLALLRSWPVFPMNHVIVVQAQAYLKEALNSDALLLAMVLHSS